MAIRVLIADDHPLILSSLTVLLEAEQDMSVVAEARNGQEALEKIQESRPDLAILDVKMPVLGGLEAAKTLKAQGSLVPVLLLSTFDDRQLIQDVLQAGLGGFLLKDVEPAVLLAAARAVSLGLRVYHPCVDELLDGARLRATGTVGNPGAVRYNLTERELEVVSCIVQGLSNKEIAALHNSSEGTIKNRISTILGKMNLQARTQIAVCALREGLV
jgi:DNA-binding NarL/FixJ family response regulator